jgi:hypothetical protein
MRDVSLAYASVQALIRLEKVSDLDFTHG